MSNNDFTHRRVLLKLSGEALMGDSDYGIDPGVLGRVAAEIHELVAAGLQLGLVIGGGNIFRGAGLAAGGMNRVTGDYMGMLATVINALAMADRLESLGTSARVLSALEMNQVCDQYTQRRALHHLDKGRVVLLAAGTGNPFFTTDSAASLRAVEIGAGLLLKATKVDGVYTADPVRHKDAKKYDRVSYDEAISRKLGVMDATALVLCRDNRLPLRVFDLHAAGNLARAVRGENIGTLVE